jgi:molybdopterin-guanine dinucleotide biosynthesis protein MobB
VVLAGGESRRFGGLTKALIPVAGEALALRAARVLAGATGRVGVVAAHRGLLDALGLPGRLDEEAGAAAPGRGPLAGLQAALRWADEERRPGVLVLACDLPLVPPALLRTLAGVGAVAKVAPEAATGPAFPLLPESPGPLGVEPLCGYYPIEARAAVEAVLAGGAPSMRALLEALPPRRLPLAAVAAFGDPDLTFLNVNDTAGRERAERFLGAGTLQSDNELPRMIGVVGWKNSGKTELVVALAADLTRRGRRVMTVKHGHGFQLDTPGTDSWRHRHEGGAARVVLAGPADHAVLGEWGPGGDPGPAELVRRYLADAHVVLVEGYKRVPLPQVEVYRQGGPAEPLSEAGYGGGTCLAVVTDRDDLRAPVPVLRTDDPGHVSRLADLVEAKVLAPGSG